MESRIKDMPWPSGLPDEDWLQIQQELPKADDPIIHQFLTGREALISEEKQRRSDQNFRQSLSATAKKACSIVDRIRDQEQSTQWNSFFPDILTQEIGANVYPGMMFGLAKERMEHTKLWQIIRRFPKGALLHAHMDAMVDADFVINLLLKTPGMHIYCDTPLTNQIEREKALVKFRFLKTTEDKPSIWGPEYISNAPILVSRAADSFPTLGRSGFVTWLKNRITITKAESIEHYHGVDAVWRKFASIFAVLGSIIFYEPIFRKVIRRMLQQLLEDGVKWVDLRLAFTFDYYKDSHEAPEPDFRHFFQVFGEEIESFKASEEGQAFWGARMIWTGLRVLDTRKIVEDMEACIAMKLAYPQLISGYDLVGQEDTGRPLKDLLPELFWFRKQCAQEKVIIPFFFHAGECLGDGTETDNNLFDAILLGTRRIGHGFSLYKHPLLIDAVKDKNILVESCPISNEVLRLCTSIISHPLPALISRGVACSLSNDDPAILGQDTAGLSHDFWQAIQGWNNLGLAGLASLAENSVRWAAFEDQDASTWLRDVQDASLGTGIRAMRLREWRTEWERYCLWISSEFGEKQIAAAIS
ncbi:hypothetical protein K3495_g6970 [Podosphaera aphanis]|nr:hypothetical protein K3495_g6970 [Podosphaera aphanis]